MSEQQTPASGPEVTPEGGTTPEGGQTTPETPSPEEGTSESELGDAGKKAIKAERDARKAAEKELGELKDEVSRLRRSNAAQKGTDVEAIKAEIRSEFETQLLETRLERLAVNRLQNPADALLFITGDKRAELSTDGRVSDDAIKSAIDDLIKERPYLGVEASGPKPWGDVGGGQRKTPEAEPKTPLERLTRAYSSK